MESINQGKVPSIETAWEFMCHSECQKQVASLSKLHCEKLKIFTETETSLTGDSLKNENQKMTTEFLEKFDQQRLGNVEETINFRQNLETQFQRNYEKALLQVQKDQKFSAFKYLTELVTKLKRKVALSKFSTIEEFLTEVNSEQQNFLSKFEILTQETKHIMWAEKLPKMVNFIPTYLSFRSHYALMWETQNTK